MAEQKARDRLEGWLKDGAFAAERDARERAERERDAAIDELARVRAALQLAKANAIDTPTEAR